LAGNFKDSIIRCEFRAESHWATACDNGGDDESFNQNLNAEQRLQ